MVQFATDVDPDCRKVILSHKKGPRSLGYALGNVCEKCDLYTAGFPCQPCSRLPEQVAVFNRVWVTFCFVAHRSLLSLLLPRYGGRRAGEMRPAEQHFGRKEEAQGEGCLESGQGHHRRRGREKLPAGHLGLCSHNHMCTSLRRQLLARQRFLSKPDLATANNQVWRVAQPAARLQPVLRKVAFSASSTWRLCRDSTTSASRAKRGKMAGNAMSVPVLRLREAMRAVLTAARLIR